VAERLTNPADIDALFSGTLKPSTPTKDRCDNCGIVYDWCLSFGSDDQFEMPVDPGGALERELEILRRRAGRGCILLCTGCTDALQTPPFRHKPLFNLRSTRPPKPVPVEPTRLFES
jgi:hypothetical protein